MGREFYEDDSFLLEACVRRDLAAWSFFVKKFSPLIRLAAEKRLRKYGAHHNLHDIEEMRQDILASIWQERKLEEIKNGRSLRYWLAVVAGNEAAGYLRRRKADEVELSDAAASPCAGPRDEAARQELSEKIDSAIGSLSPKEKLIIKLNLIHDKKYEEIVEILNIPYGTVASCIKRAKEKLRDALKDFR